MLHPVVPISKGELKQELALGSFFWGLVYFSMNLVGWAFRKYAPPSLGIVQILYV